MAQSEIFSSSQPVAEKIFLFEPRHKIDGSAGVYEGVRLPDGQAMTLDFHYYQAGFGAGNKTPRTFSKSDMPIWRVEILPEVSPSSGFVRANFKGKLNKTCMSEVRVSFTQLAQQITGTIFGVNVEALRRRPDEAIYLLSGKITPSVFNHPRRRGGAILVRSHNLLRKADGMPGQLQLDPLFGGEIKMYDLLPVSEGVYLSVNRIESEKRNLVGRILHGSLDKKYESGTSESDTYVEGTAVIALAGGSVSRVGIKFSSDYSHSDPTRNIASGLVYEFRNASFIGFQPAKGRKDPVPFYYVAPSDVEIVPLRDKRQKAFRSARVESRPKT